jgi:hypothetical protein
MGGKKTLVGFLDNIIIIITNKKMADTSVFTRLKRLFSTDVIIRNVGGNQLKSN